MAAESLEKSLIILVPLLNQLSKNIIQDEDDENSPRLGPVKIDETSSGYDIWRMLIFSSGTDINLPIDVATVSLVRRIEKRVATLGKGLNVSIDEKSVNIFIRPLSSTKAALGIHVSLT